MISNSKITSHAVSWIAALWNKGYSYTQIARFLHLPNQTVINVLAYN